MSISKKNNTERQRIMRQLRQASANPLPCPYPNLPEKENPFQLKSEDVLEDFVLRFKEQGGLFEYCPNYEAFFIKVMDLCEKREWKYVYCWEKELYDIWHEKLNFKQCKIGETLHEMNAGVVCCDAIIAETGGILLSSHKKGAMEMVNQSEVLIVLATLSNVYATMGDFLEQIQAANYQPKQLLQLNGLGYQHPIFEVDRKGLLSQEIYLFLVDE